MQISTLDTGFFKLDGGAMFGVVPKTMWQKLNMPDDNNMCTWAMRCLLVQTAGRNIVIDTGMGFKQDDKFKSHFQPFGDATLLSSLAQQGLLPEDITDVFLTHLHFDHCGGALKFDSNGAIAATFPNAVYWSNEQHWAWASTPNPREAASFLAPNFKPLEKTGQLQFIPVEQDVEWLPGFNIRFSFGHTDAMMSPILTAPNGQTLIYCADIIPSVHHIGLPFVMAYDIRPLQSMPEKAELLSFAVERNAVLLFEHDATHEAATVIKNDTGRIVLDKTGALKDWL